MALRVLTWNLKHGRAVPSAGRDLSEEFGAALAGWDWDVALLQETPPWWPATLARRLGAQQRLVLTSRNALLFLRKAIAIRWPDAIKSNGGGCNAILVRRGSISEHRVRRLRWQPERRWLHAVRLTLPGDGGLWVGNLHTASCAADGSLAAQVLAAWASGAPAVLGGDFNVRDLSLDGFTLMGGSGVDLVFASAGAFTAEGFEVLDRGALSDHAPVLVRMSLAAAGA